MTVKVELFDAVDKTTSDEYSTFAYQFKFMEQSISIDEIKSAFPDEWVLIGNPQLDEKKLHVLSGIPVYHSQDKKEVCYMGRDKTSGFDKITLIYTGTFKPIRKMTGIFNLVQK